MAETKQSSIPFTDTPEFKQAVAAEASKAASAAVERFMTQLQEARGDTGPQGESSDGAWIRKLASEIAQLNNQGPGAKKFVDPAVIAARDDARERMTRLIIEARGKGIAPRYSLRAKVYLDEVKVDPIWIEPRTHIQRPTIIEWPGVPSEAMLPCRDHLGEDAVPKFKAANEAALAIYQAFRDSIGSNTEFLDERPQRVTPGGLVVHGAPRPSRETGLRQQGDKEPVGEGLRIPHRERGRSLNVLGTVAEPAREGLV